MNIPEEFLAMIEKDIDELQKIDALSLKEQIALHQRVDSRYQACIRDWYMGLAGFGGQGIGIWYLEENPQSCCSNLIAMRGKLESYRFGMNAVQCPDVPSTNVTVNTNVNVSVTFERVREEVEDMTSLTNEQTQEILDKISQIEEVVTSTDKKKTKWEKIKPVLVWLADKSCDVGTTLLPLLLKI